MLLHSSPSLYPPHVCILHRAPSVRSEHCPCFIPTPLMAICMCMCKEKVTVPHLAGLSLLI